MFVSVKYSIWKIELETTQNEHENEENSNVRYEEKTAVRCKRKTTNTDLSDQFWLTASSHEFDGPIGDKNLTLMQEVYVSKTKSVFREERARW